MNRRTHTNVPEELKFELLQQLRALRRVDPSVNDISCEFEDELICDWVNGREMEVGLYNQICENLKIFPSLAESVMMCSGRYDFADPSDLSDCESSEEMWFALERVGMAFRFCFRGLYPGCSEDLVGHHGWEKYQSCDLNLYLSKGNSLVVKVLESNKQMSINVYRISRKRSSSDLLVSGPFGFEIVRDVIDITRIENRMVQRGMEEFGRSIEKQGRPSESEKCLEISFSDEST